MYGAHTFAIEYNVLFFAQIYASHTIKNMKTKGTFFSTVTVTVAYNAGLSSN
jgi:hypothetical protein